MHRLQEMVRLHRMGTGSRETVRLLGMSPNTERPYREALKAAGLFDGSVGELPPAFDAARVGSSGSSRSVAARELHRR